MTALCDACKTRPAIVVYPFGSFHAWCGRCSCLFLGEAPAESLALRVLFEVTA